MSAAAPANEPAQATTAAGECATCPGGSPSHAAESSAGTGAAARDAASVDSASSPGKGHAMLFIDNSSLFNATKKAWAKRAALDVQENPLARIDMIALRGHVADGRNVLCTALYATEPPNMRRLADFLNTRGFSSVISRRAPNQDRRPDVRLSVDIVSAIYETQVEFTIAVVAGNADALPALERAVARGVLVEFWTFSASLPPEVVAFCAENPEMARMRLLDDALEKVSFVAVEWDSRLAIPIERTLVVRTLSHDAENLGRLAREATRIFRLPVAAMWMQSFSLALIIVLDEPTLARRKVDLSELLRSSLHASDLLRELAPAPFALCYQSLYAAHHAHEAMQRTEVSAHAAIAAASDEAAAEPELVTASAAAAAAASEAKSDAPPPPANAQPSAQHPEPQATPAAVEVQPQPARAVAPGGSDSHSQSSSPALQPQPASPDVQPQPTNQQLQPRPASPDVQPQPTNQQLQPRAASPEQQQPKPEQHDAPASPNERLKPSATYSRRAAPVPPEAAVGAAQVPAAPPQISEEEDAHMAEQTESYETEETDEFELVRSTRPRRRREHVAERCRFAFSCDWGSSCSFEHSDEEAALFRRRGGHGVRGYKSQLCAHFKSGTCTRGRDCNYAHGEADAFCYLCLERGHAHASCGGGAGEDAV